MLTTEHCANSFTVTHNAQRLWVFNRLAQSPSLIEPAFTYQACYDCLLTGISTD